MYKYIKVNENNVIVSCQESTNIISDDSLIEVSDEIYSFGSVGDIWDSQAQTVKKVVKKSKDIEMQVNNVTIEEVNEKVEALTSKIDEVIKLISEKG